MAIYLHAQKHYWENFKITDHKYRFWILRIIEFLADKGYLVKHISMNTYKNKEYISMNTYK